MYVTTLLLIRVDVSITLGKSVKQYIVINIMPVLSKKDIVALGVKGCTVRSTFTTEKHVHGVAE